MERDTRGSMLCPNCRKLISVSAERCPHCGARRPALWGLAPMLGRVFSRAPDAVALITIACVGLYVLALLVDPRSLSGMGRGGVFGILAPTGRALLILGATSPIDLPSGRLWTVLTAIYLHGSLLHILFNVMWIRALAPEVQEAFGPARFFLIWTIAGAIGFLASDLAPFFGVGRHSMSVGASGSIFGLLGALIVYGQEIGSSMMTRQIWIWAVVLAVLGFLLPGVDNFAHVGGFAGGWVAAKALRGGIRHPGGRGVSTAALVLVVLTIVGFALSIGLAAMYFLSR